MDDKELLDIYSDYLISSFGLTTGTGLSRLLNGAINHDSILLGQIGHSLASLYLAYDFFFDLFGYPPALVIAPF